jgi:uncharacterized protein YukE
VTSWPKLSRDAIMNSQTVILTPAELIHFADSLEDSVKKLRGKGRRLRDSVASARSVWKDSKYDAFQKQLTQCMDDLERFNNTGTRYSEFLREKATLANKFLHRK